MKEFNTLDPLVLMIGFFFIMLLFYHSVMIIRRSASAFFSFIVSAIKDTVEENWRPGMN